MALELGDVSARFSVFRSVLAWPCEQQQRLGGRLFRSRRRPRPPVEWQACGRGTQAPAGGRTQRRALGDRPGGAVRREGPQDTGRDLEPPAGREAGLTDPEAQGGSAPHPLQWLAWCQSTVAVV